MSRASVWAAMEGRGCGTDPVALLGWRLEYLAQFYIPSNGLQREIVTRELMLRLERKSTAGYVFNLGT